MKSGKSASVVATPQFRRELHAAAACFFREASEYSGDLLAERFVAAVKVELENLRLFPESGGAIEFPDNPVQFRRALVPGFRNYLIFSVYSKTQNWVPAASVLHGARDIESLLEELARKL